MRSLKAVHGGIRTYACAWTYEDKCQHRNVTFPELNQTREANDGACYHYLQAPDSPPRGRCVALPYEHYYYMTDENCLKKKSPLCVLGEEQAPV
ncbi:hypothetical protein E2C01_025328 [Portunus trituberculatus]|uniref:Uncharacterized protein n=1 Tax=Portunus trituberculatus TaxID=210409 RepID=A0A5B7EFQ0_PORTR|nr:hypothetical protein [Portunus trituberculatus]